jgi:hypothetical protein
MDGLLGFQPPFRGNGDGVLNFQIGHLLSLPSLMVLKKIHLSCSEQDCASNSSLQSDLRA